MWFKLIFNGFQAKKVKGHYILNTHRNSFNCNLQMTMRNFAFENKNCEKLRMGLSCK